MLLYEASEARLLAACGVLLDNAALCSLVYSSESYRDHLCCFFLLSGFDSLLELLDLVFHCASAAIVDELLASADTDSLFG
jgi:hypothetical protein